MTTSLTSIQVLKQRLNTIKMEASQHPELNYFYSSHLNIIDRCFESIVDIESRLQQFSVGKAKKVDNLDIPAYLKETAKDTVGTYALIEAAWERLMPVVNQIESLDVQFLEVKQAAGINEAVANKKEVVSKHEHVTLRDRFSGMKQSMKNTFSSMGANRVEVRAQKEQKKEENRQQVLAERRQAMAPLHAFVDRNQSIINNLEVVNDKLLSLSVSGEEIKRTIINGIGQTYANRKIELDSKKGDLLSKTKGMHVHNEIYKKLKGIASIDFTKIQSLDVAKTALIQQAHHRDVVNELQAQYMKDEKVWQSAREVFDKPARFQAVIEQMTDENSIVALLAYVKQFAIKYAFFDKLVHTLEVEKLSEAAANGLARYIESDAEIMTCYPTLLKQAKFVSSVLSTLPGSIFDKNELLSHVEDNNIVDATLNLKDIGSLGNIQLVQVLEHALLINRMYDANANGNMIAKTLDSTFHQRAVFKILEAEELGILNDKVLVGALIEYTVSGGVCSTKDENKIENIAMIQGMLSLKVPVEIKKDVVAEIMKNPTAADTMKMVKQYDSEAVINDVMVRLLAVDVASKDRLLLSKLSNDRYGKQYLSVLATVCSSYIDKIDPIKSHTLITSLHKLPGTELAKVNMALLNLNKVMEDAAKDTSLMGTSAVKFEGRLDDIKGYAYGVILDASISPNEKEQLIQAKVEQTLEPSYAKQLWRKIKDAISGLTPRFFSEASKQKFWQADKTAVEVGTAEQIKGVLSLDSEHIEKTSMNMGSAAG